MLLPLTSLHDALIDAGYESPGYQSLCVAAKDGWIPAEECRDGRWYFDPNHLGLIADLLRLEAIAA